MHSELFPLHILDCLNTWCNNKNTNSTNTDIFLLLQSFIPSRGTQFEFNLCLNNNVSEVLHFTFRKTDRFSFDTVRRQKRARASTRRARFEFLCLFQSTAMRKTWSIWKLNKFISNIARYLTWLRIFAYRCVCCVRSHMHVFMHVRAYSNIHAFEYTFYAIFIFNIFDTQITANKIRATCLLYLVLEYLFCFNFIYLFHSFRYIFMHICLLVCLFFSFYLFCFGYPEIWWVAVWYRIIEEEWDWEIGEEEVEGGRRVSSEPVQLYIIIFIWKQAISRT